MNIGDRVMCVWTGRIGTIVKIGYYSAFPAEYHDFLVEYVSFRDDLTTYTIQRVANKKDLFYENA